MLRSGVVPHMGESPCLSLGIESAKTNPAAARHAAAVNKRLVLDLIICTHFEIIDKDTCSIALVGRSIGINKNAWTSLGIGTWVFIGNCPLGWFLVIARP